ncbi:MAG: FHA domain-containing protein [Sandaracinaceae bacterium]|nr:FHA domain-containing protein [Sandaracinaceae bacterium]
MPRFRLRYQGSDLELPPSGAFVIGRSSACSLALDDALVSRRHASIEPRADGLYVEDLGSRNGVLVNGQRIEQPRRLAHLDRVTVGAHDLVVVEVGDEQAVRCDACGALVVAIGQRCPKCGAHVVNRNHQTLVGGSALETSTLNLQPNSALDDEPTAVGSLLGSIAQKALALGRYDEAERVLSRVFVDMLARAQRGEALATAHLGEATAFALRLADGTKKPTWLDWIFEVHAASGILMSAPDVEKLHEVVRRTKYTNVGAIRRYLARLAQRADELSAPQRFQIQRLEGLLRVVSA